VLVTDFDEDKRWLLEKVADEDLTDTDLEEDVELEAEEKLDEDDC
jgi:hypothetical protein